MDKYLFKIECIIGKEINQLTIKLNNLGIPYDTRFLCNYTGSKVSVYVVKPEIKSTKRMLLSYGAIIIS